MSMFETTFGTTIGVFIGLTLVLVGGCAGMAGQALAKTWRPLWHVFPYVLLLGCADRFLVYALFQGQLLSLAGYLLDTAVLLLISLFVYRVTRAHQMCTQYPWIYQRVGWLNWRQRNGQGSGAQG